MELLPVSDPVVAVAPPPPAMPVNFAVVRRAGKKGKEAGWGWGSVKLRAARKCLNPHCAAHGPSPNGCLCEEFCTDKRGQGQGIGRLDVPSVLPRSSFAPAGRNPQPRILMATMNGGTQNPSSGYHNKRDSCCA